MHQNKGKTILKCLAERTDYAMNNEKTANGELISSFECAPQTAASEFAFSKRIYFQKTGRESEHDIIAYQFRQSFKPGEVTAEEANRIGYEFAERFLKGRHAFIVCTHINRQHIHNHVIWNSTNLDCTRKFRNFWYSTNAVRKLSDIICIEHGLSVIEKPGRKGLSYDKWLGNKAKPSNREIVRIAVDEILESKPKDMEEFIRMLEDKGFKIKRGKHLTLAYPDFKKSIRMDSLGDGYMEEDIRAIIAGTKQFVQRRHRDILAPEKNSLLIDIEAGLIILSRTALQEVIPTQTASFFHVSAHMISGTDSPQQHYVAGLMKAEISTICFHICEHIWVIKPLRRQRITFTFFLRIS